jgi:heterodisulfide reductase subunit C
MSSQNVKFEPEVSLSFAAEVMERSGQSLFGCYQCRRCAAGCPVGEESGVTPDRLIRTILLGEKEATLNNLLVWKCVACYTCGTRCPNNIQTARINEALKQMSKEAHKAPLVPAVWAFHDAFMKSVSHFGRVHELEFMALYEMKNMSDLMKNSGLGAVVVEMKEQGRLGLSMIKKKRMHMGIEKVKGLSEVKGLYNKAKGKGR